jgi:hypothetical protein
MVRAHRRTVALSRRRTARRVFQRAVERDPSTYHWPWFREEAPPGGLTASGTDADILWYGIDRTNREKAIPSEVPKGELRDLPQGLDAIRKQHAQLRQYIRTTSDDLRSHVVPRQRSDAYQWALLISTHEQRHILQIREIKADPKFPSR